jgi:hypothetical protein
MELVGETEELASMQVEEPYRLYDQLRILSHALARIHGRDEVIDHELELLRRVALSTIPTNRARVLEVLRDGEVSRQELPDRTGLGKRRTWRALDELEYVKLVESRRAKSTGGQPGLMYSLADGVSRLLPRGQSDHLSDLSMA